MVTWENRRATGRYAKDASGKFQSIDTGEIYCDSADEKPVERVANGTWLFEINTEKVYIFSETLRQWFQWGGGSE